MAGLSHPVPLAFVFNRRASPPPPPPPNRRAFGGPQEEARLRIMCEDCHVKHRSFGTEAERRKRFALASCRILHHGMARIALMIVSLPQRKCMSMALHQPFNGPPSAVQWPITMTLS